MGSRGWEGGEWVWEMGDLVGDRPGRLLTRVGRCASHRSLKCGLLKMKRRNRLRVRFDGPRGCMSPLQLMF